MNNQRTVSIERDFCTFSVQVTSVCARDDEDGLGMNFFGEDGNEDDDGDDEGLGSKRINCFKTDE